MNHIFEVAIHMDDEKIVKNIEETAEKRIIDTLVEKTLDCITDKRWGYRGKTERDFNPLKRMASEQVKNIITEHKDVIIEGAINELANRLMRTKAVKEKISELEVN